MFNFPIRKTATYDEKMFKDSTALNQMRKLGFVVAADAVDVTVVIANNVFLITLIQFINKSNFIYLFIICWHFFYVF